MVTAATHVLVLCGSDACLGPAAAVALLAGLEQAGAGGTVTVATAGVRAEVGTPWCAEAAMAHAGASGVHLRWSHRARQITRTLVQEADIILATERRYRGVSRMLDVHSANRTFTALEAAALGEAVISRRDSDLAASSRHARVAPDNDAQIRWLVEEMDSLRGLVTMPMPQHRWPTGRRPRCLVAGIDVLDPHTMGGSHRQALSALDRAMRTFAGTVAQVTSHAVPA